MSELQLYSNLSREEREKLVYSQAGLVFRLIDKIVETDWTGIAINASAELYSFLTKYAPSKRSLTSLALSSALILNSYETVSNYYATNYVSDPSISATETHVFDNGSEKTTVEYRNGEKYITIEKSEVKDLFDSYMKQFKKRVF